MENTRASLVSLFLLSVLLILSSAFVSEAEQKIKIKLGDIIGVPDTAYYVAIEKGFFEAANLEVELVPFASGGHNTQALAARQIHFGTAAPIPFLYYLGRRQDLVAIATVFQTGTVRFLSSGWADSDEIVPSIWMVVKEDAPIRSIRDLKGKTIAINAIGTWSDMYLQKLFKESGLDYKVDFKRIALGFDQMPTAVASGIVDGAFIPEPFYTPAITKYKTRVLFTDADVEKLLTPPPGKSLEGGSSLVLVHREFLKERPEVVTAFLTALRHSMNWIWRNREEAKRITAKYLNVDMSIASKLILSHGPRTATISLGAFQRAHTVMLEMGALKAPVEGWPERHVDLSFLEAVNRKIE